MFFMQLAQSRYFSNTPRNFVVHKKSILSSKIWGDFSAPFLCAIASGVTRGLSQERQAWRGAY